MKLISTIPFFHTGATDSHGDLEAREILQELIDVTDEDIDAKQILEATGRFVGSKDTEYFQYRNNFLYESVQVTNESEVAISADSEDTITVSDGSRVRETEIIMNPAGEQAYVRGVSGNTLTLYSAAGFTVNENDYVTFPSNAIEEGGAGTDAPDVPLTRQKNQVQTFESSQTVSDLMKAGKTVVKMGNGKYAYFYKLENDVYRKHQLDISNAIITGKFAKFPRASGGTKMVRTTRGVDSYVTDENGVTRQSSASDGTVAKGDFKTFSRALDAARSPKKGFLWCGADVNNAIDDTFDTILGQGNIDYSVFGKGASAKEKAVELGVNAFTIYGRQYLKSMLGSLDHPQVTAAQGHKWPNYAYYIPTTKIKGMDGTMVDRIRGRYLEIDGVNSRYHVKYLGGLAPNGATRRTNDFEISVTSWEGLEIVGSTQLGRFEMRTS